MAVLPIQQTNSLAIGNMHNEKSDDLAPDIFDHAMVQPPSAGTVRAPPDKRQSYNAYTMAKLTKFGYA
ncbi:MAG: hypothetical protein JEY79_15405 [Pseudodesulfovibrio sp.]|nr:hypothetical protein [Pseudodesulfovibrio sp.]